MKTKYFLIILLLVSLSFSGCSPKKSKKVSGNGGVYKSIDAGHTFVPINKINAEKNISRFSVLDIAVDKNDANLVYIGTDKNGIYKSSNGGESWAKSQNGFSRVYQIELHPYNKNVIYIIADDQKGERALFKTEDGGINWQRLLTQRNNLVPKISALILDENNPEIVYAGDSTGGVYKSVNGGKEWQTLAWAKQPIRFILVDKKDNNIIYYITGANQVFVSTNQGKTFNNSNRMAKTSFGAIYYATVSPQEKGVLYILSRQGLKVSKDAGQKYELVNTLLPPGKTTADYITIDPRNPNTIYILAGKVLYKSLNRGKDWEVIPLKIKWSVGSFVVSASNPQIIYMGLAHPIEKGSWGKFLLPF